MTPEHEALVRHSWARLQPRADRVVAAFYDHLFQLDPGVQQRFAAIDMTQQRVKFLNMLGEIVRVLDEPERLVSEVAALGRRHVGYGAADRDYDVVGAALIWAMERELGEQEFPPETREAWREAYALLAAVMRRAAERSRSRR